MILGRTRSRDRSRGHASRPPPLVLDFRVSVASFGVTVPAGCGYTRAASPDSVQIGSSLLVDLSSLAGIANVLVQGRTDDAWPGGIAGGEARTNLVTYGRGFSNAAWTKVTTGGPSYGAATSPFNTAGATLVTVPSGTGILAETVASGVVAGNVTASFWMLGSPANSNLFTTASADRTAIATGSAAAWGRLSITRASGGGTSALVLADGRDFVLKGGLVAGAHTATFDCAQREPGAYPSPWIPTTGATATRAASFFRVLGSTWSSRILAGRLGLGLWLRPWGARSEYTGVRYLWWLDANNHVAFDASTGVLTVTIAGASNTTSAITWNRDADVEVFVEMGAGVSYVAVLIDGVRTVPTVTGSALGSLSAGDLYLRSSSTTGHTCSWLYMQSFWSPGTRPWWAW